MKSYMAKEEYMHHWFRLLGIVGLTVLLGFPSPGVAQVLHEDPPPFGWGGMHEGPGPECQEVPAHCLRVETPQTPDRFYLEVTNLCPPRIYAALLIQYLGTAPGYFDPFIEGRLYGIEQGETQSLWVSKSNNPTGRYHVRWIGSVSSITDQKCARRVPDWETNPFPE